MPADFVCKQGDSGPSFIQQLTYTDGSLVDLVGADVDLTLRSLTSITSITPTGTATVANGPAGIVQYTPSTQDTAVAGNYMASWTVTFPSTQVMTFPTNGYVWIEIQPSVAQEPQQLVGLPEVKQWLRIDATQLDYDDELLGMIEAVRPQIEMITGPILPAIYDEWYHGGSTAIKLRHTPSFGYGTTPILTVIAASEYIGPREWPLALIPSPDLGQIYSAMLNPAQGTLTRRTAGGAASVYQAGPDQVHVIYQAGQQTIPHNVRAAVREVIRVHFRTTAAVGRGFEASADMGPAGPPIGFFLPGKAREMLAPTRKAPAFA